MRGRLVYLLVAVIALNVTYPFSELGVTQAIIYVCAYCAILGFGVYIAALNRFRLVLSGGAALVTMALTVGWILNPAVVILALSAFAALIVFQSLIAYMLVEFMFVARRVTRDVLFAGVSVYLLIGDVFIALFMFIELLTRATTGMGAFMMNSAPDVPITWQRMVYYSYVTLTTLGYGDIVLVTGWAQAFAALEAITGVLYIAVLVGRLVGVYAQEVRSETDESIL